MGLQSGFRASRSITQNLSPSGTPNPAPSATHPVIVGLLPPPASLGGPLLAGTGAICLGLDRSTWARVLLQERNWCFEKQGTSLVSRAPILVVVGGHHLLLFLSVTGLRLVLVEAIEGWRASRILGFFTSKIGMAEPQAEARHSCPADQGLCR